MSDDHPKETPKDPALVTIEQVGDPDFETIAGRDAIRVTVNTNLVWQNSVVVGVFVVAVTIIVFLILARPVNPEGAFNRENTQALIPTSVELPTVAPTEAAASVNSPVAVTAAIPTMPNPSPSVPNATLAPTPARGGVAAAACVAEDFEAGRDLNWWTPDPQDVAYRDTNEQVHGGAQALKLRYTKSKDYQFVAADLTASPCRKFSQGRVLHVWVYGELTLLLKLEDQSSDGGIDIGEQRARDPDGWTLLVYDYSGFAEQLDLDNIKNVMMFPAPGDVAVSGEFFIDDIELHP